MGTEECVVVVFLTLKLWSKSILRGGLASSAWHINEMDPPYRSDVWAWAQSSVRWWSFRVVKEQRALADSLLIIACK